MNLHFPYLNLNYSVFFLFSFFHKTVKDGGNKIWKIWGGGGHFVPKIEELHPVDKINNKNMKRKAL